VSQTPFCRVKAGGHSELWHSHGQYVTWPNGATAPRKIDSETGGWRPLGSTPPRAKMPVTARITFDPAMTEAEVEKFLAHLRQAAKEITGKELTLTREG
jgi:hypothetical protein